MTKSHRVCLLAVMTALTTPASLFAAESLAPPPAAIVAGKPVPVTSHADQQVLLQSSKATLAVNKQLVHEYWRTVVLGGQAARAAEYLAPTFVEHDPLLPSGVAALQRYLGEQVKAGAVPAAIPGLVTLIAEADSVVLVQVAQYPEPDNAAAFYTSARFDMFRIDDGRIAEHWDSSLFRAGQTVPDYGADSAQPVNGTEGLAQHALLTNDDPQLFANKRLAFDLWRQIPEGGREELAALYVDELYIQHNPNAATGRDGFIEYMARRPESPIESWLETPLVAMIAEGDLVVQVLQTTRVQNGVTYQVPWFDMFRIDKHRVIEHWDTAAKGELPAATPGGPLGL